MCSQKKRPQGSVTPAQAEIIRVIHDADSPLSTSDVWQAITKIRPVARTTVQTLIDRLCQRNWLDRHESDSGVTFTAVHSSEEAVGHSLKTFITENFAGSPSLLMMSLLGSGEVTPEEADRITALVDEWKKEAGK